MSKPAHQVLLWVLFSFDTIVARSSVARAWLLAPKVPVGSGSGAARATDPEAGIAIRRCRRVDTVTIGALGQ